jgi:hypothetical protein
MVMGSPALSMRRRVVMARRRVAWERRCAASMTWWELSARIGDRLVGGRVVEGGDDPVEVAQDLLVHLDQAGLAAGLGGGDELDDLRAVGAVLVPRRRWPRSANMPRSPALLAVVATAPDLERDAGGVLVVLLGGVVWMGTATVPAAEATQGGPGCCRSRCNCLYGHDHRVCWCVTNCVTITTYGNGLLWILRDV